MNTEYRKIETLFNRNPDNMRHVVLGELRDAAFGLVDRWLVTEKIHGVNARVIYENGVVRIGGKTDDASMPMFLHDVLVEKFSVTSLSSVWPSLAEVGGPAIHPRVVLYGEGYGPKIQKGGGNYRSDPGFRIFDVAVWGDDGHGGEWWWWLNWSNVEDVAAKLGVDTVPVLADAATTDEAIALVRQPSVVASVEGSANVEHEGIVCRTDPLLFTRRGERLIWKLKGRDLPQ